MQTAFRKYEKVIREVVDSFLKMCDYIERTDGIGCDKCPVQFECFHGDKHDKLNELMKELGIERNDT